MSAVATLVEEPVVHLDYSLIGVNSSLAVEKGLAEAEWYECAVPRETMRQLLERWDGPAIRDTILWFALLLGSSAATYVLWGSWWAVLPYLVYWTVWRLPHQADKARDDLCRRGDRSLCAGPAVQGPCVCVLCRGATRT